MDKKSYIENFGYKDKLHLGCGSIYLEPNYLNVDFQMPSTGNIDLIADVTNLDLPTNFFSEISSFHVVEHIQRPKIISMFESWYKLLKNGGKLILELPDFDKIAKKYVLGDESMKVHMWGNQENPGQFHFWGYSFKSLKKDLESVGFKNITEHPATDYHTLDEPCFHLEAIKSSKIEFHLEPTNICTRQGNRCKYCSDNDTRAKGYLDLGLAKDILDQIKDLNADEKTIMLFLSGEPLLHPQIGELISMANKVGRTVIHTNSDILTEEKSLQLINSGLKEIHLNLHYDPKTGEMNPKTLQNIKDFLILNDHQIESHVQRVVPFPEEIPDKEETLKEFPGADVIDFRRPHNWASKDAINGSATLEAEPPYFCTFLINNVAIAWDGRVFPCCADLNGVVEVGDLKTETLKVIDSKLDKIFERQQQKEKIPLCSDCERYCPYKLN